MQDLCQTARGERSIYFAFREKVSLCFNVGYVVCLVLMTIHDALATPHARQPIWSSWQQTDSFVYFVITETTRNNERANLWKRTDGRLKVY